MEKRQPWQFFLILAVVLITLYNILPTIFYYTKPLHDPVDHKEAQVVAEKIIERVDDLQEQSIAWLRSFNRMLGIQAESIDFVKNNSEIIQIDFKTERDAQIFTHYLPEAGSLIPFVPAQLSLAATSENQGLTLFVQRKLGFNFDPKEANKVFQFSDKFDQQGAPTPFYIALISDRVASLAGLLMGPSSIGRQVEAVVDHVGDSSYDELLVELCNHINDFERSLGINNPVTRRYFASFTQTNHENKDNLIHQFLARIETLKGKMEQELQVSDKNEKDLLKKSQLTALGNASQVVKKNLELFKSGKNPVAEEILRQKIEAGVKALPQGDYLQKIDLEGYDPFFTALAINWNDGYLELELYPEIVKEADENLSENVAIQRERLNKHLFNELARLSRQSNETISPYGKEYRIILDSLTGSQSFLALDLGVIASKKIDEASNIFKSLWQPKDSDLQPSHYPVRSWDSYEKESVESQAMGLVLYAPVLSKDKVPQGMSKGSIYIIAKGLTPLLEKYRALAETGEKSALIEDFKKLETLLRQNGYLSYPGSYYGLNSPFAKDHIFELNNYYDILVKASRENFTVHGSERYAVLEFSTFEQRLLTENKIDDQQQEDLIKWEDEYNSTQIALDPSRKFTVPPPTLNPYWQNFKLSAVKYFRGDDRKVLRWGLDLSGGKTIKIGLKDQSGRPVTDPNDLKQASNELYNRVNKMGVSERTIRIENNHIVLDFPGSQAFSANELVKAASMTFHIVNEKFRSDRGELSPVVNRFLQEVWNEAVVTNRKDSASINEIAWNLLGGNSVEETGTFLPRSEEARFLHDQGLQLAGPGTLISNVFNDAVSAIAVKRGDIPADWDGLNHPLMIVFRNYALEGSSLENVRIGYDPTEGNSLTFQVKDSYLGNRQGSPRDDFYAWTSQFAKDKIANTSKEAYAPQGWRMGVILNDQLITWPNLGGALSKAGTITGRFSQREITQLAADLKAGSLSFTPQILSEQNVSPELGQEERFHGIAASVISVLLVAVLMIGYYRFAGLVATLAVLFNFFIMWAVLQGMGAAITLPGIAGFVLTIGMAVDANVLVFERFKEEFAHSGRLASAIQAGYRKAFSAIVDSNITTLIAALILVQFDSGPIKGFAMVLMIGIISSMFTSLFMTRYYFAGWVQNPKNKELKMSDWIGKRSINFLSYAKTAVALSTVVIAIGLYFLASEYKSILGMDFTGGYSLNFELAEKPNITNYRSDVEQALLASGAVRGDIQLRELSRPNQLRLQLGMSMEESNHPFHNLPEEVEGDFKFPYQKNPRIDWVVKALEAKGLEIKESQLKTLDTHWSAMSGQLSDAMRNNAAIALGLALVAILIYITFRFEFKYAMGAVIGLLHDVVITLGIVAILHKIGLPVEINLQVIGAIMTIIGYSLNDTIIVFDRIREEIYLHRRMPLYDIINNALNVTLGRTLMTSMTTILVLISLDLFGGITIFGFSIVMTIGIFVGTFSSLFIAAPAMLLFHNWEEGKEGKENRSQVV